MRNSNNIETAKKSRVEEHANAIGGTDYIAGIMRAPSQSPKLMKLIELNKDNHGVIISIMNEWTKGWDLSKRAEMKIKFGF